MIERGRSAGREFGQPIPQDDGEEEICYQITIPNTSEWRVLLHSLVLHWTAGRYWKRTKDGRRIKDIQQKGWQIYETLQPCSKPDPIEPEIIEIIRTLVKEKGCCFMLKSCCCGENQQTLEGVPDDTAMIPSEIEDGITPVDVPTPTDGGFDSWKCRVSQAIIDLWYGAVLDMRNLVSIASFNTSQVRTLISDVFGAVDGGNLYTFLWEIWSWFAFEISYRLSSEQTEYVRTWINNNRITLSDILYCSTNASGAKADMIAFVNAQKDSGALSEVTWWVIRTWLDMLPYEAIYQTAAQRMNAPAYDRVQTSYLDNCSCSGSGGVPDVDLPTGYVLIPMEVSTIDPPVPVNGGTLAVAGAFYEIQGQGNAFMDITLSEPEYEGSPVQLADVVGFYFRNEMSEIVNGNSVSQRLVNSSTQFTTVNFGGGSNTFLEGEIFAGAVPTEAALQTWLTDLAPRWADPSAETNQTKRVMSWGINGGSTGSGDLNEFVVSCYWIVKIVVV